MDQPKMKMRQCRCFYVLKDYDCEILYHPGMVNIVDDSLSRKKTSTPTKGIYIRMTVITPVLDMIKQAHSEAFKKENGKSERIVG